MFREMEYYEVTLNLSEAKMRGVCFKGAVLEGCNMSLADLSGADLSRASLAGSDLTNADLSGQSHVISFHTRARALSSLWFCFFDYVLASALSLFE